MKNNYTEEYQMLRTRLFDLKLYQTMHAKAMSQEELRASKSEINNIKKEIAHHIRLSQMNRNEERGEIKK